MFSFTVLASEPPGVIGMFSVLEYLSLTNQLLACLPLLDCFVLIRSCLEMTGLPITAGIRKENPYRMACCQYPTKCPTDPKFDCSTTNITYQLTCNKCEAENKTDTRHTYIGSSGKSLHARGFEHQKDVDGNKKSNSMAKHMENIHDGINVGFTAKVIKRHKSCMTRLIDESIRIEHGEESVGLANSKSEWGAGNLVRVQFGKPGGRTIQQSRKTNTQIPPTQISNHSQRHKISTTQPHNEQTGIRMILRSRSNVVTDREGHPGDPD